MAIDPSQRMMFRGMPGVNPREIAGGIYNLGNMGGAPPPVRPVAAQPIQVAGPSVGQPVAASQAAPPAIVPPPLAPPPLAPLPVDFQTLYDSTSALIENAREKGEDVTELLKTRSSIVQRAAEAGVELVGPEDEAAAPRKADVAAPREADVAEVVAATTSATNKAVGRGEISAADANEAIRTAEAQVKALTSNQDTTFDDALKAVGLEGKDYNAENYNAKAKDLLGLDADEADVPEWAAPIFLFGLNLMKAPVSKKTSDTGLTGLLADIGAAGEVGFAGFGKERERRRKQRASVATLASQLRTQDLSLRKQVFREWMDWKTFDTNLKDKVAGRTLDMAKLYRGITGDRLTADHRAVMAADSRARTANSATRAMNSTRAYLANEQKIAMAPYMRILENNPRAMAQFAQAFKAEESRGVDPDLSADDQLALKLDRAMAPGYYPNLAAIAAKAAGITPAVELTTIDFKGDNFSFDLIEVDNYVAELNKQRAKQSDVKGLKPLTVTQVLNEALSDPKSPHRRMIIGSPKTVIKTDKQTVEGVTTERHINETARNNWFETNPQPTDPAQTAAYAAKVKAAEPQWLTVGDSYVEGKPEFKERTYTNRDGIKVKYYLDDLAFSQRRKSQPDLTMQDVLSDPDKYSKIIQGKITDYAGRGGEINTITIYDKGQKRVLAFDKIAYKNALENGTLTAQDGLAGIIKLGIGRYIGGGVDVKPSQSILTLNANGSMSHVNAQDAVGVMAALSSKKDQTQWRDRTAAVINLNAAAWDIRRFFEKGNKYALPSRALDWAGSARSLSRLVKTQLGYNNASVISEFRGAATTETTKKMLNSALAYFDKSNKFGKSDVLITDKVTRGQIKSTFLNLAFGLASAREGGKLTDNDVRNALQTLGWDGTSWTQTPEEVLGTLSNAVKDANNKYITEASLIMTPKEREKLEANFAAGRPGYLETLLRNRAKLSPDPRAGALYEYYSKNKDQPGLTLRFDYSQIDQSATAKGGTSPRLTVDQSFKVIGIPRDDLGIMTDNFSGTRIPNRFRRVHTEVFRESTDEARFITYDTPDEFDASLRDRVTELFKDKPKDYKHNGLTSKQWAQEFFDYKKYLFDSGYFR